MDNQNFWELINPHLLADLSLLVAFFAFVVIYSLLTIELIKAFR
jgi:hypothetical protein